MKCNKHIYTRKSNLVFTINNGTFFKRKEHVPISVFSVVNYAAIQHDLNVLFISHGYKLTHTKKNL